ncbi:hypothetical protein JTB14_006985 [Gonioctena quinquepunctata]|nr:hypothetical protein JTB14_006985 [Gonioctena quinquepunctata]
MLPPYIVYKAVQLGSTWTENGPENARYNRSKSGWFDLHLFEDWFKSSVLPYFKKLEGPKVLIGDNLASHVSINVIQECQNNNIRFVLLPPNSTHITQRLNVCYIRPVKGKWRPVLTKWKETQPGPKRKDRFPGLLKQTFVELGAENADNIKAGFKATGLIPINREAV